MVVKSIHNHVNLSDDEIREWVSLTPVNEDYVIHEKRLNKILTESIIFSPSKVRRLHGLIFSKLTWDLSMRYCSV